MTPEQLYKALDKSGIDYEVIEIFDNSRLIRVEVDEDEEPELIPDEETEAAHYLNATQAAYKAGCKTVFANAQALIRAIREGDPEEIADQLARFESKARHI
jgi:molybdopterin-guanine dinucleotide biosynthesis protein